jgi:hypothetical protein
VAASSNKKVLIVRFDRETLSGFIQTPAGLDGESIDLLKPEGSLIQVPFTETKLICFVRDFDGGETWQAHRTFATRPKSAGLWVRFRFRDGDALEGILPNNLLQLEDRGFSAVPPDPSSQNQRLWVPRAALAGVEVLGVIGSPLRRPSAKKPATGEDQLKMFD